mgnify:CR=1 FL=1
MNYNLNNKLISRPTKDVYKDGDNTIKLFVENYSKSDILNEALIQARIEEYTDLTIPQLREVTKIENRWAIVSEYIEGDTIEDLIEQHPEKYDEYMNWFVEIQLTVLDRKVPLLNRTKDKYKNRINQLKDIDDSIRYELLQRLDSMPDHDKLCHGDFVPSNIVIKPDTNWAIIDWAHATQGNASADAANTYLNFIIANQEDRANDYINLFAEKSGIDIHLIQKWIPIAAAVRLKKGKENEREVLHKFIDVVDFS